MIHVREKERRREERRRLVLGYMVKMEIGRSKSMREERVWKGRGSGGVKGT